MQVYSLTGDIGCLSFQSRTPRTVPSEPIIGKAVAGNAEAMISFTAPLTSGTSAIGGYTATCSPGRFESAVARSGTGSPIIVTGLSNGRTYACSVTATNVAGISLPSARVSVRPYLGSLCSRDYVRKAYVACYGRPAEPDGQSYWAGRRSARPRLRLVAPTVPDKTAWTSLRSSPLSPRVWRAQRRPSMLGAGRRWAVGKIRVAANGN